MSYYELTAPEDLHDFTKCKPLAILRQQVASRRQPKEDERRSIRVLGVSKLAAQTILHHICRYMYLSSSLNEVLPSTWEDERQFYVKIESSMNGNTDDTAEQPNLSQISFSHSTPSPQFSPF